MSLVQACFAVEKASVRVCVRACMYPSFFFEYLTVGALCAPHTGATSATVCAACPAGTYYGSTGACGERAQASCITMRQKGRYSA